MWSSNFSNSEVKDIARKHISSMEFWLRRLADHKLIEQYGDAYQDAVDSNSQPVISNSIKRSAGSLLDSEPDRFPRWIDALTLDNLIDIFCGNQYQILFRTIFHGDFPHGSVQLRTFLEKVKDVRNRIDHLNPISIHHGERAICYSNDIVELIKEYYHLNRMQETYNVPTIVMFSNSHGFEVERHQGAHPWYGWQISDPHVYRPGDTVSIEIEVDASFSDGDYTVEWSIWNGRDIREFSTHKRLVLVLEERDIHTQCAIDAKVIQNKTWHKHGSFDDILNIRLTIYPPVI